MTTPLRRFDHGASSSPLPSVDDVLSRAKATPAVRSDFFSTTPNNQSPSKFTNASSFLRPEPIPAPIDLTTPIREATESIEPDGEEEMCVIRIPAPGQKKKTRRKAGSGKLRELKPVEPKKPNPPKETGDAPDGQPWKKYLSDASPSSKTKKKETTSSKKSRPNQTRDHKDAKKDEHTVEEHAPLEERDQPLDLPHAPSRRATWTPPPPDKVIDVASIPHNGQEPPSSVVHSCDDRIQKEIFGKLLETYGRPDDMSPHERGETPEGIPEVLKKRKLIETIPTTETAATSKGTSPTKKVPKKKKPRTITERATAAYAPRAAEEEPSPETTCQYGGKTADSESGKPQRKASKTATRRRKTKKSTPEPIVLSPNAAIRQAVDQDIVFGTSSQLATEQSPGFLKNLQAAVRASNAIRVDEDPFASPVNSDATQSPPRRKLWEVGARDEDGKLLDLPVIDLINTPDPDAMGYEMNPFGYSDSTKQATAVENNSPANPDTSFPDIYEVIQTATSRDSKGDVGDELTSQPMAQRIQTATGGSVQTCTPPLSHTPSESQIQHAPRDAIQEARATVPSQQPAPATAPTATASAPPLPPKPKYELYTDAQLASEVTSYGFKTVKRRTAMVALLDQCWESKNKARPPLSPLPSNQTMSTTSSVANPAVASPKRPRGRPRKGTPEFDYNEPPPSAQPPTASPNVPQRPRGRPRKDSGSANTTSRGTNKSKTNAGTAGLAASTKPSSPSTPGRRGPKPKAKPPTEPIEIPDSESEGLGSLASSPEQCFSSPPAVDVSLSLDENTEMSLVEGAADDDPSVMAAITKAVKSAPPTQDPVQPSWHEKMLMYDPIILEDLAAWLNTGPLTKAGYDGEVSPYEVKQWCESKSVCCLWRVNLSGKERKRY